MAGVVTMASVIEDFDTQPCKKSRKDGGSPIVKTITNYFSPVAKPEEKPFSPPRSNNIRDYFIRKAPSSKEKSSSPEQMKENCQTSQPDDKDVTPEAAVRRPSQKRGRKASKAARKLVEPESVPSAEDKSCLIVEEVCGGDGEPAAEAVRTCGVFGSDTTALLVQICSEACVTAEKPEKNKSVSEKDGRRESECVAPEWNAMQLSPIVPPKDKAKQVKPAARNPRKKQQQEARLSAPQEGEAEKSFCDASMEVNLDEESQLNGSTVTISFEEFVRSQSQGGAEEDEEDEQEVEESKTTSERQDLDQLDVLKSQENLGSGEPPLQISPRTVTVQAEVHAVSPKQEAKPAGKVASIFSRKKAAASPAEVVPSAPQAPPTSLAVKRKSNVVLEEEDLELAVLESESAPKCSEVEKKQFMAAFKQAGVDGSKSKPGKSQSKQKQPHEKVLGDEDRTEEEATAFPPPAEQVTSQENKAAKKKPGRKGRKKAKEESESAAASPAAAAEETATKMAEVDNKIEEDPITSTPSIPAVRRSRREAAARQTPETLPAAPTRKSSRRNELKEAVAAAALPDDGRAEMSTPKTRRSRHGVFVAEMVSSPDVNNSPIRIKFTRVHKNVPSAKAGSGTNAPSAAKASKDSKTRKQAKKLVEKARVIQQSRKAAGAARRSSRAEASANKSYCEDEDSVVCLDEDQPAAPQKAAQRSKSKKSLRSLNDVLGKAGGKETKAVPDKAARKASAVISIFDESSRDGSENSQDDEQFRARREFLKSGLPESFRKQIAKTTATREAFSLSCSSFQPVAHVKQPPEDCPLWSLSWPESLLLSHLKDVCCHKQTNPLPPVGGHLCVKTEPARRAFNKQASGWRPELSESTRRLLTEEVCASNPPFPVQMFASRFLKRRTDHQQQCASSEPEAVAKVPRARSAAEPVGGKRKRTEDEGETAAKAAKKQRADSLEEAEPPKRGGRTRRSRRSAPEETKPPAAAVPPEDDSVIVLLDEETETNDVVKEDVLWTDKYQPQLSGDIIGNTASVRRLHSWLKEWKLRTDRDERKRHKDKKPEEGGNDSDWDGGEEESQDGDDSLCNTLLITGPTGVGKTAAVYACAQELGFKVFEVNASSQRSGRLILSQLKEATQSHQVDSQGPNAHKPTYFNSYSSSSSSSSSAGPLRPGSSPRKIHSPRRVVSSPRKHPHSPRGAKRGGLAPTSLANFFKTARPANKDTPTAPKNEQTAASKKALKSGESVAKRRDAAVKSPNNEEQSKKTATSLILFEEVDVIFDDDSGFLAAIKTFMTTTKRPVILTTSDPAFSAMFDGNFEELHFSAPSVLDASSFLQLLCLTEDVRTDRRDIDSLLRLNGCDMRQSLLQLQFWTRSGGGGGGGGGGGRRRASPLTDNDTAEDAALPPRDTSCTESMLGLLNVEPERDIWELFKTNSLMDGPLWELLTSSRRRGVDLLYSNMEALLPLPLTRCKPEPAVCPPQQQPAADPAAPAPPNMPPPHLADCSDDGSPMKTSHRMRKTRKQHRLPNQAGLDSDSDSEDAFPSLCKPAAAAVSQAQQEVKALEAAVDRKRPSPEERLKRLPVSACLESVAAFLDDMSQMDASLPGRPDADRTATLVGAMMKDGMTDESRVELGGAGGDDRVWEIPAAVEALSFHRCRAAVAEAWEEARRLHGTLGTEASAELALPLAAHRHGYSFAPDGPCPPRLVRRRTEVMETLMFRGACGILGNRPAAAADYLPALRAICRSEQLKERGKVKRRFLHYLDAIHLGLDKSTLQHLAEDFP